MSNSKSKSTEELLNKISQFDYERMLNRFNIFYEGSIDKKSKRTKVINEMTNTVEGVCVVRIRPYLS